eukprot:451741-Prymnesium_polylepis.1
MAAHELRWLLGGDTHLSPQHLSYLEPTGNERTMSEFVTALDLPEKPQRRLERTLALAGAQMAAEQSAAAQKEQPMAYSAYEAPGMSYEAPPAAYEAPPEISYSG